MPLVSVIIPNYNHARFLSQRLESVYAQEYQNFEVIILDDHSSDNSREIINQYAQHPKTSNIVLNEKNSGSAFTQWGKGISLAKGKYIWIAESDDFCDTNFLTVAVSLLEKGNDLFYSRTVRVLEDGSVMTNNPNHWFKDIGPERWNSDFENDARNEVRDYLFKKCVINNASAVVFRNEERVKKYLNQVSGMYYSGDWLFWILYLLESKRLVYSTATTNYFRTHPGVTRLQQPYKRNPEILKIFRFVMRHPLSKENRKMLAQYFFDNHIFKGPKRQIGANMVLAFKMYLTSLRFVGPWLRYYF